MRALAPELFALGGFPPHAINAYLAGGVLIDARTRIGRRRILAELRGRTVTAHAITHAHPDHTGASAAVCTARGVPLWCPAGDAPQMRSGDWLGGMPANAVIRAELALFAGPGREPDRLLREGDDVGGFTVLETPGHSPGHVSYFRERDRVLIVGDALFGVHPLTQRRGPREPPAMFTPDVARNRASIRRLAALRPALAVFGHGPPLRDPGRLQAFADALPA